MKPVFKTIIAIIIVASFSLFIVFATPVRKCITIVDEYDVPIVGAVICVQYTTNGAISGPDGEVCLTAEPDDYIEISYIGHETFRTQFKYLPDIVCLHED